MEQWKNGTMEEWNKQNVTMLQCINVTKELRNEVTT